MLPTSLMIAPGLAAPLIFLKISGIVLIGVHRKIISASGAIFARSESAFCSMTPSFKAILRLSGLLSAA